MTVDTGTAFATGLEWQAIRDAVGGIANLFGPDYCQQQVDAGGNCAELWDALGAKDFSVCICREIRRRGTGENAF